MTGTTLGNEASVVLLLSYLLGGRQDGRSERLWKIKMKEEEGKNSTLLPS